MSEVPSGSVGEEAVTLPGLTARAYNPEMSLRFTEVTATSARIEPIQFNINEAATVGTIFVDYDNNGVCEVMLPHDHVLVHTSWRRPDENLWQVLNKSVQVARSAFLHSVIAGPQTVRFEVRTKMGFRSWTPLQFGVSYRPRTGADGEPPLD